MQAIYQHNPDVCFMINPASFQVINLFYLRTWVEYKNQENISF